LAVNAMTDQAGAKLMAGSDRPEDRKNEEARRRRRKNWTLFAVLVGFVVLIYFVSIVRMSMNTP
ncbi:MAG TPA: hypothetical protein VKN76_04925, partial [Kiloniellaceae bacterium]|nr:hypothetical protein [Kiloniellaceae bacterium]